MHKPRVLIVENALNITGGVTSIERSCTALRDSFDFFFVVPKNSEATAFFSERNFEVSELPMKELRKSVSSMVSYVPFLLYNTVRISRLIKSLQIDIILVNDFYNLVPACYSFFGGRIPYICYVRFLPSKFPATLVNLWYSFNKKYAHSIVAVSQAVRKELPFTDKLIVIADPLPAIEKYPDLSNEDQTSSTRTFLYLSNFIKGKGQDYAIEAFARVHEDLPGWKLRFVGGDMGLEKNRTFISSLKVLAANLGVEKKIEWAQFTNEIELEYKKADIVLNFSESESFSMTCLEALYFGRTVIASNSGGPAEIIDHEVSGLIVANTDIGAMAAAMKRLACNPTIRLEMSKNARDIVKRKFSNDQTVFRLREVYDTILNEK